MISYPVRKILCDNWVQICSYFAFLIYNLPNYFKLDNCTDANGWKKKSTPKSGIWKLIQSKSMLHCQIYSYPIKPFVENLYTSFWPTRPLTQFLIGWIGSPKPKIECGYLLFGYRKYIKKNLSDYLTESKQGEVV